MVTNQRPFGCFCFRCVDEDAKKVLAHQLAKLWADLTGAPVLVPLATYPKNPKAN